MIVTIRIRQILKVKNANANSD